MVLQNVKTLYVNLCVNLHQFLIKANAQDAHITYTSML